MSGSLMQKVLQVTTSPMQQLESHERLCYIADHDISNGLSDLSLDDVTVCKATTVFLILLALYYSGR